jgi:serine/threonine protein kinase
MSEPFRPAFGAEPIPGYQLERLLGRGALGEVWSARRPDGSLAALKFVAADGAAAERERRSLEASRSVLHPRLLALFGAWAVPGFLVLAMELADSTLMDLLQECRRQGLSGVPCGQLLYYFRQAARALDFLNEPRHTLAQGAPPGGIVHGDVKPQNLFLFGGACKVGDFGQARLLERSRAGSAGLLTPAYTAPERFRGQTSDRSDQYSLAVSYCQLRGGELPFRGDAAQVMMGHLQLAPDLSMLPESERPAVARALSKEPGQRWPDCRAFVDAMAAAEAASRQAEEVIPTELRREAACLPPLGALPPRPEPPTERGDEGGADDVQFTVYRPRAVEPEKWYPLLAFAHLAALRPDAGPDEPDPLQEVQDQAARVLGERQARDYQPLTQDAARAVPRHALLTFAPELSGVEFNPPRRSFHWKESVHREEFRLRAGRGLAGATARGRLSVFLGDILLADVPLALRVAVGPAPAPVDEEPLEADQARPYRKIFASYSHKDAVIVEQFARFARALGDEYLRDWHTLRSGEVWSERLLRLIEQADVFQLFWSRNAMDSGEVRKEWEHALALNRPHFIRPTYWEEPLPADDQRGLPPPALRRLHFQRLAPAPAPPEEATDLPGAVLFGLYQVLGRRAAGGGLSVYEVRHLQLGQRMLLQVRAAVRDALPALERAAGQVARLHHPVIVDVYNMGEQEGRLFLATALVEGETLEARLQGGYRPGLRAALSLAVVIVKALAFAHERGVTHPNLTTASVFWGPRRVQVADFVALPGPGAELAEVPAAESGTPAYMAPERWAGQPGGPAADVFALGVILYELLTGRRPFDGATPVEVRRAVVRQPPEPPRALNPQVPAELEAVCLRCLEKDPARRYASAGELGQTLYALLVALSPPMGVGAVPPLPAACYPLPPAVLSPPPPAAPSPPRAAWPKGRGIRAPSPPPPAAPSPPPPAAQKHGSDPWAWTWRIAGFVLGWAVGALVGWLIIWLFWH